MPKVRSSCVGLWLACAGLLGCGPGRAATQGAESEDSGEELPELPDLPEQPAACSGADYGLLGPPEVILADIPDFLVPADLVATDEGLLALMLWGVSGEPDRPQAWAVRLDAHGAALTEPFSLFERRLVSIDGPRAYATEEGFMLTFCGGYGPDEMATSMPIDAHGLALGPDVQRSPVRNCGPGVPNGFWTGSRHLLAWRDNSTGPEPGFELLVDRFDASGASTGWLQIQADGELSPEPRFVLTTAGLFLISSNPTRDGLSLHRFDALGNHLADATVEIEVPDGVTLSDVAIAADHAGIVAWMYDRFPPYTSYRWHLDPEGQVLEGPITVELPLTYLITDIAPRPGGFVAAGIEYDGDTSHVAALLLDSTGAVVEALQLDPDPRGGFARVAVRGSSVFVLYEIIELGDAELEQELGEDLDTSDLRIVELGCL